MSPDKKIIGARLRKEREAPPFWSRAELARRLRAAAHPLDLPGLPHVPSLTEMIKQHENGKHTPGERYRPLYARALGKSEAELFGDYANQNALPHADHHEPETLTPRREDPTERRQFIFEFLAVLGLAASARSLIRPNEPALIGDEHLELVQSALDRLERTDAQRGGDLICDRAAALLSQLHGWIQHGSYPVTIEGALYRMAGQLGTWVGWTAYDADRHSMARQHYCETLLLARTRDDLRLEADVLQSMSLQAGHHNRPREAVRLAEAALRVSAGWVTPRMSALLNLRCAQGHASMKDLDGFRRYLTRAKNDFDKGTHEDDPWDLGFLTHNELEGIEGIAYVSLGQPARAARLLRGVLEEPQPTYCRNTAYYTVRLADALHRTGDHTSAYAVAADAVPLVAAVRSARTHKQLAVLRRASAGRGIEEAQRFSVRYDEAFKG